MKIIKFLTDNLIESPQTGLTILSALHILEDLQKNDQLTSEIR